VIATGAAAVHGCASLRFGRRAGRTQLVHSRIEAPLAVIRPFALPGGRLAVQLVTLGPGLCGGDIADVDVIAEDGAEVILTTTAATRVMSMEPGRRAEQRVRLHAGPGASLEYYPAITIPFPASELSQTVTIDAHATARIGVVEAWALGRTARTEYLQFRSLTSRTTLTVDGALTYADALRLEPALDDLANAGVLDGRRYLAAGFFYGVNAFPDAGAPAAGDVECALAESRPGLAYLRVLAGDAPALDRTVQQSLERVARAWGHPPARLDRFRC
jgi:urease accessory protein